MSHEFTGPFVAATDLSEDAAGVLPRAVAISDRAECPLVALSAVDEVGSTASTERRLKAALDAAAFGHDILSSASVVEGGPSAVVGFVKARDARLIVLGFHGSRTAKSGRLGSMMKTVLVQCAQDVLVVRKGSAGGYRRMVVCWDGEKPLLPALAAARRHAPDAEAFVLTAVPTASKVAMQEQLVREACRECRTDAEALVGIGPLTSLIRERTEPDDLIVLTTRGSVLGALSYQTGSVLAAHLRDTLCLHRD